MLKKWWLSMRKLPLEKKIKRTNAICNMLKKLSTCSEGKSLTTLSCLKLMETTKVMKNNFQLLSLPSRRILFWIISLTNPPLWCCTVSTLINLEINWQSSRHPTTVTSLLKISRDSWALTENPLMWSTLNKTLKRLGS